MPPLRVFQVEHSPSSNRASLGQAARARCWFSGDAAGAGMGSRHQMHSARSWLFALWGRDKGPWRRRPLPL